MKFLKVHHRSGDPADILINLDHITLIEQLGGRPHIHVLGQKAPIETEETYEQITLKLIALGGNQTIV